MNPDDVIGRLASDGTIGAHGIDTIWTIKIHHIINKVIDFFFLKSHE